MKIKKNGKILFDPSSPDSVEGLMRYLVASGLFGGESLFSDANLDHADFSCTSLVGAKFCHADLLRVNLEEADLHGANLRDASLTGADLRGADLRGTKISRNQLGQLEIVEE